MDLKSKVVGGDRQDTALQDAGWVHLVSVDGSHDYGRGHLKTWMEPPGSAGPNGRQAVIESFTPGAIEPRRGDRAGVRPEQEATVYPVVVRRYDRIEGTAVVLLEWLDDGDVPASIRELGGERSGEPVATTDT